MYTCLHNPTLSDRRVLSLTILLHLTIVDSTLPFSTLPFTTLPYSTLPYSAMLLNIFGASLLCPSSNMKRSCAQMRLLVLEVENMGTVKVIGKARIST